MVKKSKLLRKPEFDALDSSTIAIFNAGFTGGASRQDKRGQVWEAGGYVRKGGKTYQRYYTWD